MGRLPCHDSELCRPQPRHPRLASAIRSRGRQPLSSGTLEVCSVEADHEQDVWWMCPHGAVRVREGMEAPPGYFMDKALTISMPRCVRPRCITCCEEEYEGMRDLLGEEYIPSKRPLEHSTTPDRPNEGEEEEEGKQAEEIVVHWESLLRDEQHAQVRKLKKFQMAADLTARQPRTPDRAASAQNNRHPTPARGSSELGRFSGPSHGVSLSGARNGWHPLRTRTETSLSTSLSKASQSRSLQQTHHP